MSYSSNWRAEPVDRREDAFEGTAERAVVESGEDRGEIPARGRLGCGHGETLDAPPEFRRGVVARTRSRRADQASTVPSTASSTDWSGTAGGVIPGRSRTISNAAGK